MHSSLNRGTAGQSSSIERRIPGPPGLPWLGQLPAFLRTKFFPKQILKWAEEYNGVFRMEMMGKRYLVVADPELMAPIMGRGCTGLPKSTGYAMWDPVVSPHAGVQGIFTVSENTDMWRIVRRVYGPAMGPGSLGQHYPAILRCVAALGDHIESSSGLAAAVHRCGADTAGNTSPFPSPSPPSLDVAQLLRALSLDMLGACAFGIDFGAVADPQHVRLGHNLERSLEEAGARGRSPSRVLLPWLYEQERREGQAALDAFHVEVQSIWRLIQARGRPAEEDTSMAAQLWRLADPGRGQEALSDEQICAEIATMIVAGYETTANAVTWMLFALHTYPEAAAKLEDELQRAGLMSPDDVDADESGDVSLAAFLSLPGGHETLSSLPYLDAFVREGLRLYVVTPNGAVKEVPRGGPPMRIGTYDVEPGTTVWVPFWSMHLSKRVWERPLAFEPERWVGANPRTGYPAVPPSPLAPPPASRCPLSPAMSAFRAAAAGSGSVDRDGEVSGLLGGSSSNSSSNSSSGSRASRYVPFGDGSRNCVGQHLGMLQIKTVLSYLVSRFRVRLDEPRMGGVEGTLERQRVNLTLEVEGGMWMHLEPRGRRRQQRGHSSQLQQQEQKEQPVAVAPAASAS